MSAIELGKIQPSLKALEHMASRLGLSVGHLAADEQPRLFSSLGATTAALELIQAALTRAVPADRQPLMAAEFALSSTARVLAGRQAG